LPLARPCGQQSFAFAKFWAFIDEMYMDRAQSCHVIGLMFMVSQQIASRMKQGFKKQLSAVSLPAFS